MWARPRLRLSALRASRRTQERRFWPSGLWFWTAGAGPLWPFLTRHPRGLGSGLLGPASLPTGRDSLQREWVTGPVPSVTGHKVVATAVL